MIVEFHYFGELFLVHFTSESEEIFDVTWTTFRSPNARCGLQILTRYQEELLTGLLIAPPVNRAKRKQHFTSKPPSTA
jgi:hypothetical protein